MSNKTKLIQLESLSIYLFINGRQLFVSENISSLEIPSNIQNKSEVLIFKPTGRFIEPNIEIWSLSKTIDCTDWGANREQVNKVPSKL